MKKCSWHLCQANHVILDEQEKENVALGDFVPLVRLLETDQQVMLMVENLGLKI